MNPLTIDHVESSAFRGQPGDVLRVIANDVIEVTAIAVTLRRQDGGEVESGSAVRDHDSWVFRCAVGSAEEVPLSIEIAARNRAGAVGTLTLRVP